MSTIETYRNKMFRRLQVNNSPQLVAWAYENGVLKVESVEVDRPMLVEMGMV